MEAITTKMIQNFAELMIRAAIREGYEAELREGRAYFPGVVWRPNLGEIIGRDRLNVSWSDTECAVSNNGFKTTASTLEEAVLMHVADRPAVG